MSYSQKLRKRFSGTILHPEDLLLLETFQINYLPNRAAEKEFATLLHAFPVVYRFLVLKHPPIRSFLDRVLKENKAVDDEQKREDECQEALWEIGDMIIHNKHPKVFDTQASIKWEIEEINTISSLEGKVIADVGAGSGRIAFLVAPYAQIIYAVEPVGSFRSFIKEKARENSLKNLFVMDGTLDGVPLPDNSLDILITSNAIGWNLQRELEEIERVIRPGGDIIHLLQSLKPAENSFHETLTSSTWNYTCLQGEDKEKIKMRYFKKAE